MSNQAVFLGRKFEHQSTVTLTDAQIRGLPTTAVTLVAAQGAGTIILPQFASWYVAWADDFENIGDGARVAIGWGDTLTGSLLAFEESVFDQVSNLLADGASHVAVQTVASVARETAEPIVALSGPGQIADDPDPLNAALRIYAVNSGSATGNFTEGTGTSIVVSVAYYVLDTTTGLFVAA